jgi:hypothetical protein
MNKLMLSSSPRKNRADHGLDLRTIDRAEVAAVEGCAAHVRHKQQFGIAQRVALGLKARQRPTGRIGLDRALNGSSSPLTRTPSSATVTASSLAAKTRFIM